MLHSFPYGETSKIARLSTRDHGVQSVIAKGAARPKNRFGAGLQLLSEGVAHFYLKAHRDLHTLSAFDVTEQHAALAADLRRYASAVAVAELILRFSPAEPRPEVYEMLRAALDHLVHADARRVPQVGLAALWRTVAILGFAPSVEVCVRCGGPLGARARFSVDGGGLLCPGCGAGVKAGELGPLDQQALAAFVAGATDAPDLAADHLAAHRRLLVRFVQRHVAEDRDLHALTFWETAP